MASSRVVGRRAAAALAHGGAQKVAIAPNPARFPASRGIYSTRQCLKTDPSGGATPGDDPPNDNKPSVVDSSTRVDLPSSRQTLITAPPAAGGGGCAREALFTGSGRAPFVLNSRHFATSRNNNPGNLLPKKKQHWYSRLSDEKRAEYLEKQRVARQQKKAGLEAIRVDQERVGKEQAEENARQKAARDVLEAIRVDQERVGKEQAEEKARQKAVRDELEAIRVDQERVGKEQAEEKASQRCTALLQIATRFELEAAAKDIKRRQDDADRSDNIAKVHVSFDQGGRMETCEVDMNKDEAGRLNDMLKHILQGSDKQDQTSHKSVEENEDQGENTNKGGQKTEGFFKWEWTPRLGYIFGPSCLVYIALEKSDEEKPPVGSVLYAVKEHFLRGAREIMSEARRHAQLSEVILKCGVFTVIGGAYVELPCMTLNPTDIEILEWAHRAVIASTRGKGNMKCNLFVVIDGKPFKLGAVQLKGSDTEKLIAAYRSMESNASAA